MDFFEYKDFIEGYHGQDFFGTTHIIFMVIATLAIIAIVVVSRNMKPQSLDKYLKVLSRTSLHTVYSSTWVALTA